MEQSMNITNGKTEIHINGDPNKTIWINLNDSGIITRANKAQKDLRQLADSLQTVSDKGLQGDTFFDALEKAEQKARDSLDYVCDAKVADIVFGLSSPFAVVKEDGTTYFEAFIEALMPMVGNQQKALHQAAQESKQRVAKYINKYARNREDAE